MPDPLHLVCPQCQAVNRLPAAKLAAGPNCGRCHQPLLPSHPLNLDQQTFANLVRKSDLPLLVDFWASWCGPCKMMAPAFENAATMLHGQMILGKVNTEEERGLAAGLGIQSIPTMILFRGGQEAARLSGAMPAGQIVRWAREQL